MLEKYHRIMNIHADESRDRGAEGRGGGVGRVVKLPRGESRIGRHILYDVFRLAAAPSADRSKRLLPPLFFTPPRPSLIFPRSRLLPASKLGRAETLTIDEDAAFRVSSWIQLQLESIKSINHDGIFTFQFYIIQKSDSGVEFRFL